MLRASPELLPSLYDGSPKILVVHSSTRSGDLVPPAGAMRWLFAATTDGSEFILTTGEGNANRGEQRMIELPPGNVWAVWTFDAIPLTGLSDWWSRAAGAGDEPAFVTGDATALSAALIERSLAEVGRLTRANQLLIEDLAALRESWAHDVRLPPELEELLANLRAAPPRLVFETPGASGDAGVPAAGDDPAPGLRQRLPMGARGFLGVDLHVAAAGAGDGVLDVALVVLETEGELARWRLPYHELEAGWLPLRLPSASTSTWRALELRIHASGGATAPRLSCAPAGLLGEYACAAPDGDAPSGTMLLFRLWGGIPGLKTFASSETAALPANPVVAIPEQMVAAARSTRDLTWAYSYFGYLDRGRVLLRPLKELPASAACISLPAKPGLAAVSCKAAIDDGFCKTRLLTRLVVTGPGHSADDAEQGVGVLAASEWVELAEPLKPFALTARLPQPESGPVEIHFLSRLPKGGTLEHGRVIFSRFEAELDERAAWTQGPIMPETGRD